MRALIKKLINSPTLMTMGGVAAKSLSVVVILLVARNLPKTDIQVWFSFSLLISLQNLADFGFAPSIARVIAYAFGGAKAIEEDQSKELSSNLGQPNWELIGKIYATLKKIYLRLNAVAFGGLLTVGTFLIYKPIQQMENPEEGWVSWGVILFVSVFYIRGNIFFAYLEGVGKVAVLRRWEMIFHFLRAISSLTVLLLDGGILPLILANQFWLFMNVVRNRLLSHLVYNGKLKEIKHQAFDKSIYRVVFSKSWKSAVGQLSSVGITYLTALLYNNFGKSSAAASYQMAFLILQMIGEFSRSPFYSQIPFYNMLVARSDFNTLVGKVKRSMTLSLWLYTIGVVGTGICLPLVLEYIDSNVDFVHPLLWILLAIGIFGERYGALHIQLYTTTNHVVWHIANSVAGVIYILTFTIAYSFLDLYAYALAFILSNFGFYLWYNVKHVYQTFPMKFWYFESRVSFPPLFVLLIYLSVVLVY